jgi:hypothetical protein
MEYFRYSQGQVLLVKQACKTCSIKERPMALLKNTAIFTLPHKANNSTHLPNLAVLPVCIEVFRTRKFRVKNDSDEYAFPGLLYFGRNATLMQ